MVRKLVITLGLCLSAITLGIVTYLNKNSEQAQVPAYVNEIYQEWKLQQRKLLSSPQEDTFRLKVFYENFKQVEELKKRVKYEVALNQFADMTHEEFLSHATGGIIPDEEHVPDLQKEIPESLLKSIEETKRANGGKNPKSIDWRDSGLRVKNQQTCGSCWSFAAVATIEVAWAQYRRRKTRNLDFKHFSEQELVDCSRRYNTRGCSGGWMDFAYEYVKENGLSSEESYPYEAIDTRPCENKEKARVLNPGQLRSIKIPKNSGMAIEDMVAQGAVAIGLDASALRWYNKGVIDDPTSCSINMNHGVTIVGYGYDKTADLDYWIIKNSWGPTRGEDGYYRVMKTTEGGEGLCGLHQRASFVWIED